MKYSWQHPGWSNFIFNETLCKEALYQYALEAGRLSGGVSQLENALLVSSQKPRYFIGIN